jgi:hypothetical protein
MNSTDPISCICESDDWSIAISILSIVLPLIISEILPFCPCNPNGVIHAFFVKCKK